MLLCNITIANAQNNETMRYNTQRNDTVLYIENIEPGSDITVCSNHYDRILVYAQQGCEGFHWEGEPFYWSDENPLTLDHENASLFSVTYIGCDMINGFYASFRTTNTPNSSTRTIWKRQGYMETLEAVGIDSLNWFSYHWNTGEDTGIIDIVDPGIYTCEISDICGTSTRTFIVKDNVEIESASVDPDSNKNLVTWDVTPEQAMYISNVGINRDGVDIATAPYTDGQYLDNIGSDLAARTYTITGICANGTPCPIPSLVRGTIHMAFLPDINGNVEMTWNHPELGGADIHVGRFDICEYDPNGKGQIIVIDFVGAGTTSYSCNENMFDYGYPLIRAVIQDGRGEKDMLSNRTEDLVGIHEIESNDFAIYPNPSNGMFTIHGSGILTISNMIGQIIFQQEIDGESFVELPAGVYVAKLGDSVKKVVVE